MRCYLWPDHAGALSARALGRSVVFLWAAREPMLALLRALGAVRSRRLRGSRARLRLGRAVSCASAARAALLAAGRLEARGQARPRDPPHRRGVHRAARAVLGSAAPPRRPAGEARDDYSSAATPRRRCRAGPARCRRSRRSRRPAMPTSRRCSRASASRRRTRRRRRSPQHRDATAERHKLLGRDGRVLEGRARPDGAHARGRGAGDGDAPRGSTGYVEEYEKVAKRRGRGGPRAHVLGRPSCSWSRSWCSAIALGGAFVNFQLIALPDVGAGARGRAHRRRARRDGLGARDRADGDGGRHLRDGHARRSPTCSRSSPASRRRAAG